VGESFPQKSKIAMGVWGSYRIGKLKEFVSVCDKGAITEIDSRDDYLPHKK